MFGETDEVDLGQKDVVALLRTDTQTALFYWLDSSADVSLIDLTLPLLDFESLNFLQQITPDKLRGVSLYEDESTQTNVSVIYDKEEDQTQQFQYSAKQFSDADAAVKWINDQGADERYHIIMLGDALYVLTWL